MSEINVEFEREVARFYQSLGITQGPGDPQYRVIIKVIAENDGEITPFSEIRKHTDLFTSRGSIGSKMKTVFQFERLVQKVDWGGYKITDKGRIAAKYIDNTAKFYNDIKQYQDTLDRIP